MENKEFGNAAIENDEATKINSMIAEEEEAVKAECVELGRLYFKLHADDCEDAFKEMIASIRQSEKKIEKYNEKLRELKGVVRCEKCGEEVSAKAAFCNSCGAPMPKSAPEQANGDEFVRCSNCGEYLKKGSKFCTTCGSPVEQQSEADEQITENAENEAESVTPTKPAKVCPICGFETDDEDMVFCVSCGARMIDTMMKIKSCPACGFETPEIDTVFCVSCGARMIEKRVERPVEQTAENTDTVPVEEPLDEPMAEPAVEPIVEPIVEPEVESVAEPAEEAEPITENMIGRKCPACGTVTANPEMLFCTNCGTKLASEQPKQEYEDISSTSAPEKEEKANVRKCPGCGAEMTNPDMMFCTNCGTRLEVNNTSVPEKEKKQLCRCAVCGFETTDEDALFCNNCGAKMSGDNIKSEFKKPSAAIRRCPNCSYTTTNQDMLFCTECGSRLI